MQIGFSWFVILKRWIKNGASKWRLEVTVGDNCGHINTHVTQDYRRNVELMATNTA